MRLFDGQHHSVDSSEMAFKIAGSMAFKQAVAEADAYLLEPIMQMTISVPEDAVGDVIGDLNSRRGRPLGMEPKGAATEIKAEVPMAEVLDYAPDLRAITGGRGDYTMDFLRYEEVPGHIAQKVVAEAKSRRRVSAAAQVNLGAVEFETCAVCGRTILRGERCFEYVDPEARRPASARSASRERRPQGWLPAGFAAAAPSPPPPARRRGATALRERFARTMATSPDAGA